MFLCLSPAHPTLTGWLGLQTYCPARHATTITSPTSCISSFRYALTQSSLARKEFVKYEADCVYGCLLLSFVLFKVFLNHGIMYRMIDRVCSYFYCHGYLTGSNQFVLFRTMLANSFPCLQISSVDEQFEQLMAQGKSLHADMLNAHFHCHLFCFYFSTGFPDLV